MITATAPQTSQQPALLFPFRFSAPEREVFRAKGNLRISQWAEKSIYVPRGAHVGMYRNEFNPYGVDVMDTWQLPHVREVNVCAPPQAMKTIIAHCCMGNSIPNDPCEMMLVMPTRDEVREEMDDRIIPMIENSPVLSQYISRDPDDTSKFHVKLNNGAIIYTAWANSASKLARKAIKKLFFDETDKYPEFVGKETDPFNLGEKRKRTFKHTYKIYRSSSPTTETGPIWRFLNSSAVIKHWQVYCPDCGAPHVMHRRNIRYPAGKTPEEILQGKLARYQCPHCKSLWTDTKRDFATRCGEWIIVKGADIRYPRSVGYHISGCAILDISLSEIAKKEVEAKTDEAAAIDLANDYDAEPYRPGKQERKEDQILRLRDEHLPRLIVPRDVCRLLLLVDTQQIGFHYEVAAFGWGRDLTSWRVDNGFVEHFENLKELAEQRWSDADGREYAIHAAFIDSGGGTNPAKPKHSRTMEVYQFCIENPIFRPLKGRRDMDTPWSVKRLEYFPSRDGKKIPIPGGLNLYTINVTMFKNQLAGKLSINPERSGAFHLHAETDEEYAKQMCAEYRDDRGYWICPPGKANHYWDLGVYRFAAAEIVRIRTMQKPDEVKQQPKPVPAQPPAASRPQAPRLPGWFRGRG